MNKAFHKVIIYHDEVKDIPDVNLRGHILLFVPISISIDNSTPLLGDYHTDYFPRIVLYQEICKVRKKYNFYNKMHFSDIGGKKWTKFDEAKREILGIIIDALKIKSSFYFNSPLNCKFAVIFYPKGKDLKFYSGETKKEKTFRYDETLLRILIKGSAHFLYDSEKQIEIEEFITDGFSTFRPLNENRILFQIKIDEFSGRSELRNYVHFDPNLSINHLPSDHRNYEVDSTDFINANLLQVADLLLGSINRVCFTNSKLPTKIPQIGELCSKKDVIAVLMKNLLEKKFRGKGFIHSSHYKTFVVSKVDFLGDEIVFSEVGISNNNNEINPDQLPLIFNN